MEDTRPSGVRYLTDDPKAELLAALPARDPGRWPVDRLNRCAPGGCAGLGPVARALARLPADAQGGAWERYLPDVSLLRVTGAGAAQVFTLLQDEAHSNVGLMLGEDRRREPELDRATLIPGQVASYPNLFFEFAAEETPAFVEALLAMRAQADWLAVVERYALRRTSPRFWPASDAFTEALARQDPLQAGLLDLNRYIDPKPSEAD